MTKQKEFQKLTLTDQALQMWLAVLQISKPKIASVPLKDAMGRVLAQDLQAKGSLPRFDKSAMDGYAVRAGDTTGALESKPVTLKLTENAQVAAGEAQPIWTGNPIPKGADAVVIIEETEMQGSNVIVYCQVSSGLNVAKVGEDVEKGTVIAKAGCRLNPYHIGLAAALGYRRLRVYVKPKIGVLATGSELADIGTELSDNLIYDSNRIMFTQVCIELGAQTTDFGIVRDDFDAISDKIQAALKTQDAVITTGGTSVGAFDLVSEVVNRLGKPGVIVHGVAMRPGMPTAVASLNGKPILILSGNPVAAIIGFEVFGRPMVSRLLGMEKTEPRPMLKASLTKKAVGASGKKTYLRVKVSMKSGSFLADPVSTKGPGSISTMTKSNGYVVIPENCECIEEGQMVTVHMFGAMEVSDYV